jgi:hypothetical protein
MAAGITPALGTTLHSCSFTGDYDGIDRGFYITSYQGYSLDTVVLGYAASVAGTYTVTLTARLNTYSGTIIGASQTRTVVVPDATSGEVGVIFSFGNVAVPHGSVVTFTQHLVSGPGALYYDIGSGAPGACQYIQETAGTTPPLDSPRFAGAATTVGLTITGSSSPVCTASVTPTPPGSNSFTANGGTGAFSLAVSPASCSWTVGASSPPGCFGNVSPTSGTGNATITYTMAGNQGPNGGTCYLGVGDQTFSAQLAGCTYALGATAVAAGSGPASGSVAVQPSGFGCQWSATASASAPWITLTSGSSGVGSGAVGYSLAANPGAQRLGTITVAGQTYTVTQAAPPVDGLWIVDAEAGASGRGFQIETRNGTLVFTYYGYAVGGGGLWSLSAGTMNGNNFSAAMHTYHGGAPLGGVYSPATTAASLGTVSITFTSPTTGTITFPGEAPKAISKFDFNGVAAPSVVPANGLWIVNAEAGASGRGFEIEQHGGTLVLTYYGYLADGNELWTLSAGNMSGSGFSATMDGYSGGAVLGGTYAPAVPAGDYGTVSINFTSPTTGTITFPGEAAKAISKFIW